MKTRSKLRNAILLAACLIGAVVPGSVDEGHSRALEVAGPWLEKGFTLREDYWRGDLKLGEQLEVKHQMFKGNEYIFWFGVAVTEEVEISIRVYDIKGNELAGEIKSSRYAGTMRVNPPATGTYRILLSVDRPKVDESEEAAEGTNALKTAEAMPAVEADPDEPPTPISWALAYGYR